MKMCGIRIRIIFIIAISFISQYVIGQCDPQPEICNEADCGQVEIALASDANNVFCQGDNVEILIDESASSDFDILIYYWCDGTVDTLDFANQPGTHTYNISEDEVCNDDKTDYFMQIIGVKFCGDEYSCRTTGVSLTILHEPRSIFDPPAQSCVNQLISFGNAVNTSCNADEYEWSFGDGMTSSEQYPEIIYSSTGLKTVTLTVTNECGSHASSHSINVLGIPESVVTVSAEAEDCIICLGTEVTFTDMSNEWSTSTIWNISPSGANNWEYTDTTMNNNSDVITVDFKEAQTYTVQLTASNICDEDIWEKDIEVLEGPTIDLEDGPRYCENGVYSPDVTYTGSIENYSWTFEGGSPSMSTESNPTNIAYNSAGTFTVTLMVTGGCGPLTTTTTIIVDELVEVSISAPSQYCQGDGLDTLIANVNGGVWSGPGIIDSDLGIFDPGEADLGNNEIIYTYGSGSCNDEDMVDILVLESGDGVLAEGPSICDTGLYTPTINYSGDITGYSWSFEGASPSTSDEPFPTNIMYSTSGTFVVTLIISSDCGDVTLTTDITVDELIEVSIIQPDQYCQGSAPDTLIANVAGGVWSGQGIIDENLGIFDPMSVSPGMYEITYTYGSGVCVDVDMVSVLVIESETVTAEDVFVCAYEDTITLMAIPDGGVWSGTYIDSDGIFDVQAAPIASHTNDYFYTDINGCDVNAAAVVTIEMIPTIEILDTTFLCVSGGIVDLPAITFSDSNVSGGIFSYMINGVTVSNNYTIGNNVEDVPIIVQYEVGACIVSDTAILSLIEPPALTVWPLDTIICISAGTITFESNIEGGMWSGPGIDPSTGEVDIISIGGGMYDYQYTLLPNTSCEVIGSSMLEVIDPAAGLVSGPNVEFCDGDYIVYTLSGASPSDGYWSGAGIIDSISGEVDVSVLEIDSLYTYNYCLDYTEFDNCEACVSKTLIIHPLPVIQYDLIGGACIGETFTINDSTLYGQQYMWDFGDGFTSTEREPTHSYSISDFYDIVLTVTSSEGCVSINTRQVYVSRPPIVDFNLLADEGCAPFLVQVENNSSGDDISYQWIIAGDTITDALPQNIIIDGISTDSIFEIILNVTNTCGTVTQREEVLVHPYPIVDIGLNVDEGCSPVTIDFGNLTTGNPEDYFWDLGNGNTSTDSIPLQQTYTTTDSLVTVYNITLISTNDCGVDTGFQTVTVYPPDVKAFISIDTTTICQYDSFNVQSFSTPGSELTWSIYDTNNTQIAGYEGEEVTIVLNEHGTFQIILFASRCGTDSDTASITVLPAPELDFNIPSFICQGDSLAIENTSPSISETIWEFGDGNISTEFSPVHFYDTSGIFQITLNGFSSINNCPFSLTKEIEVIGKPIASFTPSTINGCRPLKIDLTNNSVGATNFNWYWNDGTSIALEENPSHTYLDPGTYNIELVVFDEFGCFGDTAITSVIVNDLPTSIFSTDKDSYCQFHDSIVITNNSIDDVVYNWVINDTEDDREMPVLYSEEIGPQNIILIVENIYGCKDTSTQSVNILPSPIADGITNDTIGCQPFQLAVTNQSSQSDRYVWNINNQETSSDNSLDFLLNDFGDYKVELIAINDNGCPNDTSSLNIKVKEKPMAEFDANKDSICGVPMTVTITNLSGSNIIDYDWTLGNGLTSQLSDPIVTYTNDEDYYITLIVENELNCLDTAEQVVEIWQQPIADISLDERSYCEGETVIIENNSLYVNDFLWIIGVTDSISTFSPEFIAPEEGQYSIELIVSYNEQCKDTVSIQGGVSVYNTPIAEFDHTIDPAENIIGDVEFINKSLEYEWIEWNLGDGSFSNEEEFIHEYDINRGIKVTLFAIDDNDGEITCIDSISKTIEPEWITTFFAPNALSPNYGSDELRYFTPKGIGLKEYEINIYSPWGKVVWTSNALIDGQPSESWNGLINNLGPEVAQGAYTWLAEIEFVDGRVGVFKGSVTVLR